MAKFDDGVTRNPYHPKGKQVFAVNFDKLSFRANGKSYEAKDVLGAFPKVNAMLLMVRDDDGNVVLNDDGDMPITKDVLGTIEIIGKPESCGCSASSLQVPKWWDVKLVN